MKKKIIIIAMILLVLNASAQYKKVSFFTKEGRTVGIGNSFLMMGNGNGTPLSIDLTIGKDNAGKLFSFYELKIIPSHKFSYTTDAVISSNKLLSYEVNEKNAFMVNFWVNGGYYFVKHNDKTKLQPYVTAGAGILAGSGESITGNGASVNAAEKGILFLKKTPTDGIITIGLRGGVGCLYNFTPKIALKADIGYSYAFLKELDESRQFPTYVNHSYVGIGVRFKVVGQQ